MQKEFLEPIFINALEKIGIIDEDLNFNFEVPKNSQHGDLSTNIAMQLARQLKKAPIAIANDILKHLEYDIKYIEEVTVANPGFINIKFSSYFYALTLEKLCTKKADLGRFYNGNRQKVNVEYVSVNPTGLLHLGHGRNAVIGDTVANLYEWLGYEVTREYYFNNAGNQMNNLAKSIYARYMQLVSSPDYPMPEAGYFGEYIVNIAQELTAEKGNSLVAGTEDDLTYCRKFGEKWNFEKIKNTLEKLHIVQDVYYNEDSLYTEGKIEQLLSTLKERGLSYEKEGAIWLKLTELGLESDRVIVKSTGEPTYRLPDIAYHIGKFERGFDILVDVFGADHIATIPDVMATVSALGYNTEKIKVLIHQFVTLTEEGEQIKMSKRTGKNYTLDDLLEEVSEDVVRFFLLMRSINTHLEFDLSLAKEQSEKNPVFYLQYAYARICSIMQKAEEANIKINNDFEYNLIQHPAEINLIKTLLRFEETVSSSAHRSEPHILAEYLRELANDFHIFYYECRILADNSEFINSRLLLARVVQTAMKNGLTILGISAPEKM